MPVEPVFLWYALTAGVVTFFSPCSVALIPAYVGYYLGLDDPEAASRSPAQAAASGARFGGAAAGGIVAIFAVGGAVVYVLRSRFSLSSRALGDSLEVLAVGVGGVLIVLGILMLFSRGPSVTLPVRAPQGKSIPAMAGFGIAYAVASMGCTLPIFFLVLAQAVAQGPLGAFLGFLAFGLGLAALMFVASVALSIAKERAAERIRRIVPYTKPVGGAMLVLAGLYVLYYYLVIVPV